MPFFRNAVYIIKEKTFLKVTSVIFRLFTNLLRICMYIYTGYKPRILWESFLRSKNGSSIVKQLALITFFMYTYVYINSYHTEKISEQLF